MTHTYTVDGKQTYGWVPEVGQRFNMRGWSAYRTHAPEFPMWAWFTARQIVDDGPDGYILAEHYNAGDTGEFCRIPIREVGHPIGWKQRYTIHVSPQKLDEVLGWIKRGVAVRASHALENAGAMAYQPADNCDSPHWQFVEITDVVQPEHVADRIRVVKLEQETDAHVPCKCRYCDGTGKRTPERNPALVGQGTEICGLCGNVEGFSFDKPYHPRRTEYDRIVNPSGMCSQVRPAAECWVCDGTGIGKRYLGEMSAKERKQAILSMKREGWEVGYERRGAYWWRERETVVKDYGKTV